MRQGRAQHDPSVKVKTDAKRRGNFLVENKAVLLATGVIAAAALISFVVILLLNGPPPLQPRERVMLTNYEEVRVSLAHDDLNTAERLAARMAREFGDWVPVSSSVELISNSDSLEKVARLELCRASIICRQPANQPKLMTNASGISDWRINSIRSWRTCALHEVVPSRSRRYRRECQRAVLDNRVDQCQARFAAALSTSQRMSGKPMAGSLTRPNRDQLLPCPEVDRSAQS
jgi:hypothetical protein